MEGNEQADVGGTAKSRVWFDDVAVSCARLSGVTERVEWSTLQAVLIRTTDDGPWGDDLLWVLVGPNSTGCVIPSTSTGIDQLLPRLQQLPSFDNHALLLATQSITPATYLCWQSPETV